MSNIIKTIGDDGVIRYTKNGVAHREDGPAVIRPDGLKIWIIDGDWHRECGPAIIYSDGRSEWYQKGFMHRVDGPASRTKEGTLYWCLDGGRYTFHDFMKELDREDLKKLLLNPDNFDLVLL